MAERIGFVGLGIMGKPMAKNLLKAGYSLTVYDIVGEPVEELVTEGAAGASTSKEDRSTAVVTDTALIDVIKRSLNSPVGALSQFKAFGNDPNDIDGMYDVLTQYWQGVKIAFPEAWGKPPTRSRLMHSAGIKAMGALMNRIMTRVQYSDNPSKVLKESLNAIAPQCAWTSGKWPDIGLRWNEVQNVPRHVKALSEQLVKLDFDMSRGRQK